MRFPLQVRFLFVIYFKDHCMLHALRDVLVSLGSIWIKTVSQIVLSASYHHTICSSGMITFMISNGYHFFIMV